MQMRERVTGTRRASRRANGDFGECERHPAGLTFLTSSASRSVRRNYARRCQAFPASRPPPYFFTGRTVVGVASQSLLPLGFPVEGNLEGRRIKVSLPLHTVGLLRKNLSSRTIERRRAARRSERVAERFGAITSFRFSKPACVKEHVCWPAIKYWWAPSMVRYGRAHQSS